MYLKFLNWNKKSNPTSPLRLYIEEILAQILIAQKTASTSSQDENMPALRVSFLSKAPHLKSKIFEIQAIMQTLEKAFASIIEFEKFHHLKETEQMEIGTRIAEVLVYFSPEYASSITYTHSNYMYMTAPLRLNLKGITILNRSSNSMDKDRYNIILPLDLFLKIAPLQNHMVYAMTDLRQRISIPFTEKGEALLADFDQKKMEALISNQLLNSAGFFDQTALHAKNDLLKIIASYLEAEKPPSLSS